MKRLATIRPSNLVILSILPFIVYLFTMVPNYRRSISAIVGIETGAATLLLDCAICVAILLLGSFWPFLRRRGLAGEGRWRWLAFLAVIGNVALAFALAARGDVSALAASIVANVLDPSTSDLVAAAVSPRQLTPEGMVWVSAQIARALWLYAALSAVLALGALFDLTAARQSAIGRVAAWGLTLLNGALLAYLLLAAHLGFAAGLFTTLRAGIFAYMLAAVLGLIWAGLLHVPLHAKTIRRWAIVCALAFAGGTVLSLQAHTTYVLIGSLDKRVAIVKGTPKALVDTVRFGQFEGGSETEIGLRSSASNEQALALVAAGDQVSGALVPAAIAPADQPVLWQTSFLPDRFRLPATFLFVGGILLSLLTFSAHHHGRHPLSVCAEFFIDTVRGIPMLVIILFVGLPFAGALKDVSGGTIDMPNVLRGVIAIAIGYSAYLAEIFRAGIEAVPRGQVEAARSLGLNNWKVARLVVLPQALKIVVPALGNEFIAILKDTSLLSILSVRDVTQRMREFQSASFLPFAPFNSAAILYVFVTLAAASLIAQIERRYDVKGH
ncbi:MAG: amino acid ABC transporter permease [Defluviimonas sp.]|nr:amino acid ABC transporter permease [Paracoccaceae bacterium]MCC0063258.1 amino acid ABC transporter permease [Defluviimonas sp.]